MSSAVRERHSVAGDLREELRDPQLAATLLSAVIDDGFSPSLLLALRELVASHGGVAAVAAKAGVSRTHLYKMLSSEGNPTIQSIDAVLHAVGLRLSVTVAK